MGYACPVCAAPQADGEHLANHLAFSALLHGDEHEEWLDEHAPDWSDRDPDGLAEIVVEHAEHREYDTTGDGAEHDHGVSEDAHSARTTPSGPSAAGIDDEEVERIVSEARELTAKRHDDGSDDADGDGNG